jgi:hypothetical protein
MIAVGVLLIVTARFTKHRTWRGKILRPVTDTERLILFSFGTLALVLGLFRLLHR